jgi:hypothetical protein
MDSRSAEQPSNWQLLDTFWSTVGQSHAPPAPERRPYETQLLDCVTDKYRDSCLTALSRDLFNRQERYYTKIARFTECLTIFAQQPSLLKLTLR